MHTIDPRRQERTSPVAPIFKSKYATTRLPRERSSLTMLKMRLAIFLYRHPTGDFSALHDAIENAQTNGEIQLLLDYILMSRGHAPRGTPLPGDADAESRAASTGLEAEACVD